MNTHVGQVQVELEVVVAERVVLRRVEHLEQRRRRVAAVVRADLVDLVEQHDRVHRAGLLDGPDDPAGQRADVRPPVAADLGLVADAAERDPDELAARASARRDSPSEVLPTPGGPASRITAPEPRPPTTWRPRSARRARTARYSTIRSLTSSRPWWSASRTARAATRSVESSVVTSHGSSRTVSSQVRIQAVSGLWSLERSSLSTSREQRLADRRRAGRRPRPGRGSRRRPRARPRRAPCGSRRAAGAAGTRAGSSPCPSRTSSPILSVSSASARCSRVQRDQGLEPRLDVGVLEQLALAVDRRGTARSRPRPRSRSGRSSGGPGR